MTTAIETLLERRGLLGHFRRQGHRLFGPCPVHGGDNPRAFVVDLRGDRWYCFSRCRRGGGPVALARSLGLSPHGLPRSRPADETVRAFVPYTRRLRLSHAVPWLARKGIRARVARDREVGLWAGRGMLSDCVALRLHDTDGNPLGYAGRRLAPNAIAARGKWVFPRGTPKSQLLYGFHRVEGPDLVLTECPWGVLRLAQLGINAVALLGVGLSARQEERLVPFKRVVVMMDGDGAGRAAQGAIRRRLGHRAVVVELPEGHDPDDLDDSSLADSVLPFLTA